LGLSSRLLKRFGENDILSVRLLHKTEYLSRTKGTEEHNRCGSPKLIAGDIRALKLAILAVTVLYVALERLGRAASCF
jgi:hypothetical protein